MYPPFENFTTHIAILCIDTKIFSEIKNIAKIKALEFIDLKFVTIKQQLSNSLHDFTNLQTKLRIFKNLLTNQIVLTKTKPEQNTK